MRSVGLLVLLAGCDAVFGIDPLDPLGPPDEVLPPGPWREVTVGDAHVCALQLDDSLWCWGNNSAGQLGFPDVAETTDPARVDDAAWAQVVARGNSTCGIRRDGSLWCWGANSVSQLGDGTKVDRRTPVQLPGVWVQVSLGKTHGCGVRDTGAIACWGVNTSGQLGTNDMMFEHTTPTAIMSTQTWTSVHAAGLFTCALATDGTAWCWGSGFQGELGNGNVTQSMIPTRAGTRTYTAISVGDGHTCGLREDAHIECWGANYSSQLGDGTNLTALSPTRLTGDGQWTSVSAGGQHTCATRADGSMWCWGANSSGQVGNTETSVTNPLPREVIGGATSWSRAAAGERSTCAVGTDNNLWCWGAGTTTSAAVVLERVQVPGSWREVTVGASTTCGVQTDGSLSCWGANESGQIGDGSRSRRPTPTLVALGNWRSITITRTYTCALDENSHAWCWGTSYGGLGDGSIARYEPVRVAETRFRTIAGGTATLAIEESTGRLWCWGSNYYGQCGGGDTMVTATPRMIGTASWTSVVAGSFHGCGRSGANTLCWGHGVNGQLGTGTLSAGPVAPIAPMNAAAFANGTLASGESYMCALAPSGVAYCWGSNFNGELGNGAEGTLSAAPVVVAGMWRSLDAGFNTTCAIATDSTLWCWGGNQRGQYGNGTLELSTTPVQVDDEPVWTSIAVGGGHACGIKADESLWCWGANESGQVGTGEVAAAGTPQLVLP